MPHCHLIRILSDGATEWLALERDGRVLAGPQAGWPTGRADTTCVLVPADDVLLLRAPRVGRTRRQLEQAVPFAIEEQLAAPVEQMHVALDDTGEGDELGVAVVTRARMDAWLAELRAAGIEPDRMLPESALLPCDAETATVLGEGPRAILRYARSGAFAGHEREVRDWLQLLAADGRAPQRLRWIGSVLEAPAGYALEVEANPAPLRWFAARPEVLGKGSAIDLLQGRYAPRRQRDDAQRLWRWAAILAGAALALAFAHSLYERQQLQQRYAAQRAEMEQILKGVVPGLTRIVDPKAQLAAEVTRLDAGGEGGVLPLLARIAPVIFSTGRFTLDGLEYRGDSLELVVRGPDVATLDSLRESLAVLALNVELTAVNPGSGGVEGRLRIRSRT